MQKLAAALVAFRSKCPAVQFDSRNPHFDSRFASLRAIHAVVDPILADHGLAVLQFPVGDETTAGCVTRIIHESGEMMEQEFRVPIGKADAQRSCAAVSYARRFGLSGALGIVTAEDVDGNDAVDSPPSKQTSRKARTPRMSAPNREKIKFAARERIKELGDESIGETEIIQTVARSLGYSSAIEMTDDDYPRALEAVQGFEPGTEAA